MTGLDGKVALVTGGASGIGLATAELFATHGASVVIADLSSSEGEARASELQERGLRCTFVAADVTDEGQVESAIDQVTARFGGLHAIVASAGIRGQEAALAETTFEAWRRTMAVNLDGVFLTLRHGIPAIAAAGGGTVVVVSSVSGMGGEAGWSPYSASKAGVLGLARAAALETIKRNVRINAVCPGYIDTPMTELFTHGSPVRRGFLQSLLPIGRLATAREVADVILFLSTDQSAFLVGAAVPIDGGLTARSASRG